MRKRLFLLLSFLASLCTAAQADEVRVLSAGAAKHAIETLAAGFERATGHRLRATYDTVGAQRDRVLQAPPAAVADVVVLSDAALAQLREAGKLANAPATGVGRVEVALAVPAGQPVPDLSNAEQLRRALLAAPSIAYADPARGATAGTHFARVVDALGLRDALAGRMTVLPFGVDVIEAVSQGRFALGVSQSSEIMNHPGVRFAGALPAPHAQGTAYGVALAAETPAARALLDYLASPPALQAWQDSGFRR